MFIDFKNKYSGFYFLIVHIYSCDWTISTHVRVSLIRRSESRMSGYRAHSRSALLNIVKCVYKVGCKLKFSIVMYLSSYCSTSLSILSILRFSNFCQFHWYVVKTSCINLQFFMTSETEYFFIYLLAIWDCSSKLLNFGLCFYWPVCVHLTYFRGCSYKFNTVYQWYSLQLWRDYQLYMTSSLFSLPEVLISFL